MTSLEKKTAHALKEIGFYVDEHHLGWHSQYKIGSFKIDFALPNSKIALEVDGRYWHGKLLLTSRQAYQKERDFQKDNSLRLQGWKVIRVSERTLNSDNLSEILNHLILSSIEV